MLEEIRLTELKKKSQEIVAQIVAFYISYDKQTFNISNTELRGRMNGFATVIEEIANAATDKAINHYDKELRPYLEDAIEVISNAQGEWYSVTKTYAPEWTHPYKQIEELIDEALKKLVEENKDDSNKS